MSEAGNSRPDVDHWDAYWRAWDEAATPEEAGGRDAAPGQHWARYFECEFADRARLNLIDIACGHGPVTGAAIEAARRSGTSLAVHCADHSRAAIDELLSRYPGIEGLTCDAANIPLPDRRFDYVVSQFGIEYAGPGAFAEAARLVSDGGSLHALVHLAGGAIHAECAENLEVTMRLRECGFMKRTREAFAAGFDVVAGRIAEAAFREAEKRLEPATETAKALLREKGTHTAGGLLARLFSDIGHMYARMRNYAPDDVFAWLDGMASELASYEGRMASMTRCAVDRPGILAVAERLTAIGLGVEDPNMLLLSGSGKPGAWILAAKRPA